MTFVIISRSVFELSVFSRVLLQQGNTFVVSQEKEDINRMISAVKVDAVIADEKFIEMVRQLTISYPMIPIAVISSKAKEHFHQFTEGLGIFMQLKPLPEKDDALGMLKKLNQLHCQITS